MIIGTLATAIRIVNIMFKVVVFIFAVVATVACLPAVNDSVGKYLLDLLLIISCNCTSQEQ